MGERDEANTMRVLLVTDTHLGFQEDNEELGEDSYAALQEALEIARASGADFVLHSGDMFHNNRPSRQCLYRAITILRERCVGDGEVRFAVCSRAGARVRVPVPGAGAGAGGAMREVDTCAPPRPNFEDPNFNIDLPVWAIHGNHDDPSGPGPAGELAALDVLAAANLVNYFGKVPRQDEITVTPIIMQKGTTRVALYGLGSVKDERLCDTFEKGKVHFLTPEHVESYFNILALHQNRVARGTHAFVPDACLPSFLNLVVWGHEHDCRIEPEPAASGKPFHITQPGSTVTVALSKEELAQKHVGLLTITGTTYTLTPIPLRTTRPFIMDTISLADMLPPRATEQRVTEALLRHVNKMIRERLPPSAAPHQQEQQEHRRLPLVRLRVEGTGYDTPHPQRFGQELVGRVANPGEVLRVMRRGAKSGDGADSSTGSGTGTNADGDEDDVSVFAAEYNASGTVDAFLDDYFSRPDKLGLRILNPSDMFDRIKHCRPADVKDTVQQCLEALMSETRARLQSTRRVVDRDTIIEELGAAARARALMAQAPPAAGSQPPQQDQTRGARSRDTASEILHEIDAGRVPVIGSDTGDPGDGDDGDGDTGSGRRAGRCTPSRGRSGGGATAAAGRRTPAARRGGAAVASSQATRSTQGTQQKSQTRLATSLLDELSGMSLGTPSQLSCPPPKKTRTSDTSSQRRSLGSMLKQESQPRRASDPVVIDDDDLSEKKKSRGEQDKKGATVLVLDDDSDGSSGGDDVVPGSVPGTQQQQQLSHSGFAVPQAPPARQSPSGFSSAWSQSAKQSQMYDQWGQ